MSEVRREEIGSYISSVTKAGHHVTEQSTNHARRKFPHSFIGISRHSSETSRSKIRGSSWSQKWNHPCRQYMLYCITGVGEQFLRRTTLKTLLLPVAPYITFVYFSYNLLFKIRDTSASGRFWDFRKKNETHVALRANLSGHVGAADLVEVSKDTASLLVRTRKKIFCLGGADFWWVTL